MHYSYTRVGAKTCLSSRFTQKCSTPTLGFPTPNKCSKFLLISLSKFCCRKEAQGYAKVIHEKKRVEKIRQVSEIYKTMGT
jgi:hypothetical protein